MFRFRPTHQEILILPQSQDPNVKHVLIQREEDDDRNELFSVKIPMDKPRQMDVRYMNRDELKKFILNNVMDMLEKYSLDEAE